jgi:hypothetical protein
MDPQPNSALPAARPKGRLWTGIFLIGLGLLFLLGEFNAVDLRPVGHYWPIVLLALGVIRMAIGRGRERWSGYWMLVAGIYCSIGVWRPLGLSWNTAWPLFVIAAGVSIVLRASSGRRAEMIPPGK